VTKGEANDLAMCAKHNPWLTAGSGQIRYLKAEGFTSVEPAAARPILPDSTFWIASFTKLLTTVAALQCVEKGLLSLDGDVSGILPEWKSPDILTGFDAEGEPMLKKATKKITLRLLLTHSSGMSYVMMSPELRTWQEWTKVDPKAAEGDIVCASDDVTNFQGADMSKGQTVRHTAAVRTRRKLELRLRPRLGRTDG